LLAVAASVSVPVGLAQRSRSVPREDTFLSGPPFSLDDILRRVGIIADKRLSEAISRRGISFSPTKDDYDRLKSAGAHAPVLQAIAAKVPAAPKAPPPPPSSGPVAVECQPLECDVTVNGQPKGQTDHGSITLTGLPTGQVFIDLKKDGYIGQQLSLELEPGVQVSKKVTLEATSETQQKFGQDLLSRITDRLGGADALRRASLVGAAGKAVVVSGGQRTEWAVITRAKLPLLAAIEITAPGLKWRTSMKAADIKSDGTGKLKGSPTAVGLQTVVRLFRDYQLPALLRRMSLMRVSSPSASPDESGHLTLNAVGDTDSYRLTLLPDGTVISVKSPSGTQIAYADYALVERIWYPKSMVIQPAGPSKQAVELHFTEVLFPASIPDREFHF